MNYTTAPSFWLRFICRWLFHWIGLVGFTKVEPGDLKVRGIVWVRLLIYAVKIFLSHVRTYYIVHILNSIEEKYEQIDLQVYLLRYQSKTVLYHYENSYCYVPLKINNRLVNHVEAWFHVTKAQVSRPWLYICMYSRLLCIYNFINCLSICCLMLIPARWFLRMNR